MVNLTTNLYSLKKNYKSRCISYRLIGKLGEDYPQYKSINCLTILDSLGRNDFFLSLHAAKEKRAVKVVSITLAVLFAESTLPIFERNFPTNNIPSKSIQIAKDFLKGNKKCRDIEKAWVEAAAEGKKISSFSPGWFAISAIEQAIWVARWNSLKNPIEVAKKVSNMALNSAFKSGERDLEMQRETQMKIIRSTLGRRK